METENPPLSQSCAKAASFTLSVSASTEASERAVGMQAGSIGMFVSGSSWLSTISGRSAERLCYALVSDHVAAFIGHCLSQPP